MIFSTFFKILGLLFWVLFLFGFGYFLGGVELCFLAVLSDCFILCEFILWCFLRWGVFVSLLSFILIFFGMIAGCFLFQFSYYNKEPLCYYA